MITSFQSSVAQRDVNRLDEHGQKTGPWEGHYPDGSLRYKGTFEKDRPTGTFSYYFEDGALRATNVFAPGGAKAFHQSYSNKAC